MTHDRGWLGNRWLHRSHEGGPAPWDPPNTGKAWHMPMSAAGTGRLRSCLSGFAAGWRGRCHQGRTSDEVTMLVTSLSGDPAAELCEDPSARLLKHPDHRM